MRHTTKFLVTVLGKVLRTAVFSSVNEGNPEHVTAYCVLRLTHGRVDGQTLLTYMQNRQTWGDYIENQINAMALPRD